MDKFNLQQEITAPKNTERGFNKIKIALTKTSNKFFGDIFKLIGVKGEFNNQLIPEIEMRLIQADVGIETSTRIISLLKEEYLTGRLKNNQDIIVYIKKIISTIFEQIDNQFIITADPTVIFMVGVNGSGKTTTVAKLAYIFKNQGKKVLLAAADTFRAAAVPQLTRWANIVGVDCFIKENAAPATIVFESVTKSINENYNILLVDTSGRLHNKVGLMEELAKMRRVANKQLENAPHHTWLVLDATIGQNAISQVKSFLSHCQINGLIITKLDSSAKGGILIGLVNEFQIPVYFIGIGEQLEQLIVFNAPDYIESLFS